MAICMVVNCGRESYGLGLCEKHYQRLKVTGTLQPGGKCHAPLEERFRRKFEAGEPDVCWLWNGARNKKGYGFIQAGGKKSKLLLAHRLSYELHHKKPAQGLLILHSCDNPSCVNPNHLRTGSQSENITEAIEKKRKFIPSPGSGEANPRSKLTLEQAKFIKAHPEMKHTELAQLFGLSPNCIRGVRIGRTWKDS